MNAEINSLLKLLIFPVILGFERVVTFGMAHSLEAVSVDKLEGFLVCSICLETLKDPRTLPCFHSYCKTCLEKFVKNQRDKSIGGRQAKKFNCPTCRSKFTLNPGQEVADMTTNNFVCNMLDVMTVQDYRVKGVPCSHCQGSSVGRCVTCEVFLCRECLTDHNKYRGFKDHSVLTMDELSKPENQSTIRGRLYCKEHSKKALKFYCETCSELICRYCMDFNHEKPSHSCLPVEKVADKEKKLLASQCVTLAMELKCGKKQFKAISDVKQSLERSKEQVRRDIDCRKDTVLSAVTQQLNEEVERLNGQVEEIYSTKYGALTKQQEDLSGYVDRLDGCVNLFKRLLFKGTNEEMLSSTKMIKENMEKMQFEAARNLTPVSDGQIDYKYDTTDDLSMPEIISKMGKVKLVRISKKGLSVSLNVSAFIDQYRRHLENRNAFWSIHSKFIVVNSFLVTSRK